MFKSFICKALNRHDERQCVIVGFREMDGAAIIRCTSCETEHIDHKYRASIPLMIQLYRTTEPIVEDGVVYLWRKRKEGGQTE